ncbi:hypothetical protein QCA50_002911 [Cerrena zonata]|uniref:Uncharacterized protein n=1 Tax=Cerrena zonata TaxID=2478898 RepID=A0AAW0GI48_9APHY
MHYHVHALIRPWCHYNKEEALLELKQAEHHYSAIDIKVLNGFPDLRNHLVYCLLECIVGVTVWIIREIQRGKVSDQSGLTKERRKNGLLSQRTPISNKAMNGTDPCLFSAITIGGPALM